MPDVDEPLAACGNSVDDDSDGVVNDGCPVLGDTPETGAECTNAIDDNGNKVVNDGCPAVGTSETAVQTDPYKMDSDGDTVVDGVEAYLGYNPVAKSSKPSSSALNLGALKFFRACRWNLPDRSTDPGGNAIYAPWDTKYSNPQTDRWEVDPDGDGLLCDGTGASKDSDNDDMGTGTEISDKLEIYGYNTNPASVDTDGDGCADWVEIMDLTGDRAADVADQSALAVRTLPANDPTVDYGKPSDVVMDITKDNSVDVADQAALASNLCGSKNGASENGAPWFGCNPNPCPAE
jgi:hypothetical protein